MKTRFLLLLVLGACATPRYTDPVRVAIDGRDIVVYRSDHYPGQYNAMEMNHAPGFYPARDLRQVRAIEAVTGCPVHPASVLTSLSSTQAVVVCAENGS